MKKARRFYRNGAYFCNSNCFKKVDATAKAAKAEAAEAAAKAAAEAKAAAAAAPAEEAKG